MAQKKCRLNNYISLCYKLYLNFINSWHKTVPYLGSHAIVPSITNINLALGT